MCTTICLQIKHAELQQLPPSGKICTSKDNEVPSASHQLAELSEHREVDKLTTTFDMPKNEPSTSSFIDDECENEVPIPGYAVIDIKDLRQN